MYLCPVCHKQFDTEEAVTKHSLQCWREQHPYHKSKEAPHSEDKVERKVNDEVLNFFASLQKRGQ